MANQLQKIELTANKPDAVYYSPKEDARHYCKFFAQTPITKKYLLLVVKHTNDEGFVVTAFFISRIKTKDKVLEYGKDSDKL